MRAPFSNTSSPPSTELCPASMRNRVVLPAPLRPASVMRSPRSSLNDTPRNSGAPATSLSSADAITTATRPIVTHVAHRSHWRWHPRRVLDLSGQLDWKGRYHSWDERIGEL